ncbi:unnamed protein product [Candidula unifasciata]|uniref:Uncharacterized protein n=1 Tax=Candidula unifasciata TaxID=100452 RepID=A0A8S3ZEE4_9EUPU|nr:unnamed protein product [Candidula unifasciata]
MTTVKIMLTIVLLTAVVRVTLGQLNTAQDGANANAANTIYYLDSNSDCNGPTRELFGFEATIRGNDISTTRLGPKSCVIRLRSSGQFQGMVLDIEVKAMNIQDCSTVVTIFDGDENSLQLMSFDCKSNFLMYKKRFQTTGDTATFQMKRENLNSYNFDIEIKVSPIRGGTKPGYENNFGYGYFFDKFPQQTIVAMIGGFYGLILAICVAIFIQCCCKYQKLNKQWEVQQLATIKKGAAFDTRSQASNVWSVEMKPSKGPGSQYSDYKTDPPLGKTMKRIDDGNAHVYNNVDTLQTQRLMGAEKEKPKSQYVSSNASFTEPEEDSDHFVEKVITPRVKTNRSWQRKRPPSYAEAVSDHISDPSSEEESEVSGSDSTVKKRPPSSSESRSERSGSSYTQSETESEAVSSRSSHASRDQGARAQRENRRPHHHHHGRISEDHRHRHQPELKRAAQPQPVPAAQLHMQQVPYGAYPSGQFVPVMVGPNQFQQMAMAPNFPPPGYSDEQAAVQGSHIQPTDPPVYSYLVQRGYRPLDARSGSAPSMAGSHRAGGGQLEDSDLRLDSGVEYMKR